MHWLEAHIHHLLLPATSFLLLVNAIYLGMRRRAGLPLDEIPSMTKAIYFLCCAVMVVLAVFYHYR